MMDSSTAVKTVSKNGFYNLFGAFWQFFLIIIGTRIVINIIGADSFGILALVGGVSGYFTYMEIGIAETIIKKISEAQDEETLNKVASTLFFFSIGIGIILAVLVTLFALHGVEALFNFEPELMHSLKNVFLVIASLFWVLYPLNLFGKIFIGLQRLDLYNILRVVFQSLMLGAILLALQFNKSAESAVVAITLIGLLWKISAWVLLKKTYPNIRITLSGFDSQILKDSARYKTFAFIGQASGITMQQCDMYVIGMVVNPSAIAIYAVANTIAIKIAEASGVLGTVIFPALSNFYGGGKVEQVKKVFVLGTQMMALLLLPVTIFAYHYAETIIRLWVGDSFMSGTVAMQVLAIAWLFNAVTILSALTVKAIDRPDIDATYGTIVAVSNIALDFLLVTKFGMIGAVYATLFCQFVGMVGLMYTAGKKIEADVSALFMALLKLAGLSILLMPIYYIKMPMAVFFIRPIAHSFLLLLLWYFLIVDEEYKGYIKNMGEIVIAQLPFIGKKGGSS